MNCILYSITAETGSKGIRAEVLSDLGVKGTAHSSEGFNGILLTDLHNDAGTVGHLLAVGHEFWQHASVNFEEFGGGRLVHIEHLHR